MKIKRILFSHSLWLVYLGVLLEVCCVGFGLRNNCLLFLSLLLIIGGIVAYVAGEKDKKTQSH